MQVVFQNPLDEQNPKLPFGVFMKKTKEIYYCKFRKIVGPGAPIAINSLESGRAHPHQPSLAIMLINHHANIPICYHAQNSKNLKVHSSKATIFFWVIVIMTEPLSSSAIRLICHQNSKILILLSKLFSIICNFQAFQLVYLILRERHSS